MNSLLCGIIIVVYTVYLGMNQNVYIYIYLSKPLYYYISQFVFVFHATLISRLEGAQLCVRTFNRNDNVKVVTYRNQRTINKKWMYLHMNNAWILRHGNAPPFAIPFSLSCS